MMDIWLKKNLDFRELKNILANCLMEAKQLVLGFEDWEFYPRGESGIFLIATSHASVHTYPEHKYITVDVYSCDPDFCAKDFEDSFLSKLPVKKSKASILTRGI